MAFLMDLSRLHFPTLQLLSRRHALLLSRTRLGA